MKIIQIGELPEELYGQVGGKAKGLDFLKKHGYNVPKGFIITEIGSLSEDSYAQILQAFKTLQVEKVSVRSSASNEDGGEYSNAGQYETCLNVTEKQLKSAVEKCLASLKSERVTAYSKSFLNEQKAKMNLVVQEMISSKAAGVTFSTNPVNNADVLIESVDGMGENLVSGSTSAYRYSVSKEKFSFENNGNLTEALLRQIYTQALQIVAEYKAEVDLEWVVDNEGALYWLQVRPITSLIEADIDEFNSKNPLENHLLTTRNIGEMMPGAITPLSISTSVLAIDYGMRYMLKRIGVIKKESDKPDYYAALAINNHLFIDLSALYVMTKKAIMASPEAMNLSVLGEEYDNYPVPSGKDSFILVKVLNGLRFASYLFSSKKAKKRLTKICETLKFEQNSDARSVYNEISQKLSVMNDALCCHYVCSSFSGAMNSALLMTLGKDYEDKAEYQSFIATLLSDIDGIESADILASLRKIAKLIKTENPDAVNFNIEQLLEYVTDENHSEVHKLYLEFIEKHGHRSIKEAELRSKAWKNDLPSLMKNLHTVLVSDTVTETASAPFDIKEHVKGLKGSKKGAIKWIGKNARQAVVNREFSKSKIIKVIDFFKDRYIILAKLLVKEGLIADEDCIYFLTHDEIGKLIDGESSLKRMAMSRRIVFKEAEELSFNDICIGKPVPIDTNSIDALQSMKGVTVCKGKIYGKARVVKNVEDAEKIEKGEIMVAGFTDIGWSPYYSLIGALITEVGSTLSHGAVVAREYCLPTIVNVKNATKLIKTGDYLLVDATRGTVSVVTEKEYEKVKGAA